MLSAETTRRGPFAANTWKLELIRLLFWMHFISAVLIPFYRDWGGLSFRQILLVNGWFMVWNFLLEVPTGTVADVWGRRASLILGSVIGAIGAVIYVSAPDLTRFLIAEIIFATSFTLMSGADEALLYDTLKAEDRQAEAPRRYGRLAAAQQIGIVTGALLGSVIVAQLDLRAPLLLQAIPMSLAGMVALTLREPPYRKGEARPGFSDVLSVGVRRFVRSPVLRVLALDMVLHAACAWMIIWFYQPMLERVGVTLLFFGAVHTAMSLAQIAVLSNVAWLTRVTGSPLRLLRACALVTAVSLFVLAVSPWPALSIACIVLTAAAGLARPPLFAPYLNANIESSHRATMLSVVAMLRTLVIALAYLPIGLLADRSLPLTLGVLAVVASLVLLFSPLREWMFVLEDEDSGPQPEPEDAWAR